MISTADKYARAMKAALDLDLDGPIDYPAATARVHELPPGALDRSLDLLLSMLDQRARPKDFADACPTCGSELK